MKYEIISLADVPTAKTTLVSHCFQTWKEVYEPILTEAHETLSADYFYRCKMLSVLHDGEQNPIAFSLLNNMNSQLAGVLDLSYFEPAPEAFKKRLQNQKEQVMTIEWVTVHPNQRGKFTKIQPADLIMGLTLKLATYTPYTAVMGYSRVDMKADKIGGKYGPQPYAEINRHGIVCKVMFAKTSELHGHPLQKVQSLIDELWTQKENHSSLVKEASVIPFPSQRKSA
ncbi:MAG: hypothetical protein ACAH59_00785 [Pseudobdellovibrionaceae bacterium]